MGGVKQLEVTWHICSNLPESACHATDRHVGEDAFISQFRAQYTVNTIIISLHIPTPV